MKKPIFFSQITQKDSKNVLEFTKSSKYYLYSRCELEHFTLDATNEGDKWIMLKSGHIMKVIFLIALTDNIFVYGNKLKKILNVFERPIPSSCLNIFQTNDKNEFDKHMIANVTEYI